LTGEDLLWSREPPLTRARPRASHRAHPAGEGNARQRDWQAM